MSIEVESQTSIGEKKSDSVYLQLAGLVAAILTIPVAALLFLLFWATLVGSCLPTTDSSADPFPFWNPTL